MKALNIKLAKDTIERDDLTALSQWVLTNPRLTKGDLTENLESAFAKYVGTKHSVFVNSGSSAILIGIQTLLETKRLFPGQAVVIPAICWATDLMPVLQLGLRPIICDCNPKDFSLDLEMFKTICKNENPGAVILVSVLGISPNMNEVIHICNDYGVILLEDACESLGSEYHGKKLGSFGEMSFFSSYYGHHISTIEGGFVATDDTQTYEILKSVRAHGWLRDLPENSVKDHLYNNDMTNGPKIDPFSLQYTFFYSGFNCRNTDLAAFIGIRQMTKLPGWVIRRQENFKIYSESITTVRKSEPHSDTICSSMAFPILAWTEDQRYEIVSKLNSYHVECRPLIAGNIARHPVAKRLGRLGYPLPFADHVHTHGLYLPNHHNLTINEVKNVSDIVNSVS